MKKYYIPTSTFNFNNLLSSESISPKAFYARRGFGYSRWLPIAENNIENVILLYDKPFNFSRPTSDVEDHPMLVEIQSDEEFKPVADGIYYCDHTIYLSPWHTRFLFFAKQDMNVALSLSESSLETKMLRLYRRGMAVEQHSNIKWANINLEISLNEQAMQKDHKTNRMKGLLYGYYIGALLTSCPEIVRKYNALQELQNIFSAILSSDDHTPTIVQEKQIRSLIHDMQKELPYVAYIEKQLAEPQKIDEILAELSRLGVSFPSSISANSIINDLLYSTDKDNKALKWLDKQKEDLHNKEIREKMLLNPDKEEIIINEGHLAKIAEDILTHDKELELVKIWINDILSSDKYNGKVSSFKSALADDVTIKAKDFYGEQWGSSEAKVTLNNMRRYINGSENDFQWDNLLISSIAAVIAKGSDWTELLSFLKSKNICDYRLAFAFYGELNGFANLTRDFTDLLLNEDSKYVASVYKEFAGQLLGVDVTIASMPMNELALNNETQAITTTDAQTWKQDAEAFIWQASSKKDRDIVLRLLNETSISTAENFISYLKERMGWTNKKGIVKGLKDLLLPHYKGIGAQEMGKEQDKQPTLGLTFDEENTQNVQSDISSPASQNASERHNRHDTLMFKDRDWWNDTASMISDSKARKQYLKDIEWFIENHNESYNDKKRGVIKGYYSGQPTENARLLEGFRAYLQNKLKFNSNAAWVSEEYSKIPVERIIQYLESLYADR